jgi:hypothetical protein
MAMLSGLGHGLEAFAPPTGEGRLARRLHLSLRQGRLAVGLW